MALSESRIDFSVEVHSKNSHFSNTKYMYVGSTCVYVFSSFFFGLFSNIIFVYHQIDLALRKNFISILFLIFVCVWWKKSNTITKTQYQIFPKFLCNAIVRKLILPIQRLRSSLQCWGKLKILRNKVIYCNIWWILKAWTSIQVCWYIYHENLKFKKKTKTEIKCLYWW